MSYSDPEEDADDIPDDKDTSRSGICEDDGDDGDGSAREDEENDPSGDFTRDIVELDFDDDEYVDHADTFYAVADRRPSRSSALKPQAVGMHVALSAADGAQDGHQFLG